MSELIIVARYFRMTFCGTPEYSAPEMLFQEEYTSGVDIFSLGMVFLEVINFVYR